MENSNVLIDRGLLNQGIDSKDCKNCVFNCENGCPSSQSKCWCCKDKSEFLKSRDHQFCFFLIEKDSKETILEFEDSLKFLQFFRDNPHMVNGTLVLVVDFESHIGVEWFPVDFIHRCLDIAEGVPYSTSPIFSTF